MELPKRKEVHTMNIRKTLAVLGAVLFCLGNFSTLPSPKAQEPYRILCVGDSITHGYINADNGYRKYLCYYLQQNGIAYDMVGPENNWTEEATYNWNGTTITYDPQHCGYSGYSTMSYSGRIGIYETLFGSGNLLETYQPDIVLLQIGTNDLLDASLDIRAGIGDIRETTTALERLETVVDEILANLDGSDVLFVTTIPDIDAVSCASWVASYEWTMNIPAAQVPAKVQECVDLYNAGIKALVAEKQAEGKSVQLGDVNSIIDYTAGDLEDGCHPSEQGYAKMGVHWAEKITAYLNNAELPTQPPTQDDAPLSGDVHEDGTVDVMDIIQLQKYLLATAPLNARQLTAADMNADGKVNGFDLAILKRYVLMNTPMPL
jgi:lysophospholipase L1-like esterase